MRSFCPLSKTDPNDIGQVKRLFERRVDYLSYGTGHYSATVDGKSLSTARQARKLPTISYGKSKGMDIIDEKRQTTSHARNSQRSDQNRHKFLVS